MSKPSKQRPWVVQMNVAGLDRWFDMDAYRSEDEAEMNAALFRKRAPEAEFRVVQHIGGSR
jgi:hypothetical protein